MALISMYERDNSRTVYRILAESAVKCLDDPQLCTQEKIPLTNLARLLERYRYDAFSDHVALGVLEVFRSKNTSSESSRSVRHMEGVIAALEAAHAHVYGNLPKDDLVQTLQAVLSKLASSSTLDEHTRHELPNARRFFSALSEGLRAR